MGVVGYSGYPQRRRRGQVVLLEGLELGFENVAEIIYLYESKPSWLPEDGGSSQWRLRK